MNLAGERARPLWPAILVVWLLAATVLLVVHASDLARIRFYDPDDAMRLLEVRDWLAGQSWWDVSQHRLGAGIPFAMHWSRLVDLPLAGVMLLLRPIVGDHAATVLAMTIVPLITLGCIMALVVLITRRLLDDEHARIALLLTPIAAPIVAQAQPLRIDHHGWQIALALAAVLALVSRPNARNGALAGLAVATLVTVSFEGLPIAAALCAIAALHWALVPAQRTQVGAMLTTFAAAAAILHLATRGPVFWSPACDAVAPAWLAVFAVAAVTGVAATAIPTRSRATRLALLAIVGMAATATLLALAPTCLSGPFGMLDPFVRQMWYAHVAEGLPIWRQEPIPAIITLGAPMLGLVGTILALRRAEGESAASWRIMLALLGFATVLALLVLRAGGTATALAIPGIAFAIQALLVRARTIGPIVPRVAATAGTFCLAAPSMAFPVASAFWPTSDAATSGATSGRAQCADDTDFGALRALPQARLFAPLDIGPEILVRTDHAAVASGYHRNNSRIHFVMAAFVGTPVTARRAVRTSGAAYVVGCPGLKETELYDQIAPNGFWARLERGERFDWLTPIAIPGSPILVWRVVYPSHLARAPLS